MTIAAIELFKNPKMLFGRFFIHNWFMLIEIKYPKGNLRGIISVLHAMIICNERGYSTATDLT